MFDIVFTSLNESIKKRNKPEDFIPNAKSSGDIIHRGYLKTGEYPIKYSFMPDGKGSSNTGSHIYNFKDKGLNGIVEISHRYSPTLSGHETKSHVQFEYTGKEKLDPIDLHRMMLPIINHHIESHDPDIISFGKSVKYADDIIRRMGVSYTTTKGKESTIAKKSVDPKFKRVLSHIKRKMTK